MIEERLNQMTQSQLRTELSRLRREMMRYRMKKTPFQEYEYENYITYYAIYDKARLIINKLNRETKVAKQRINAFYNEAHKTMNMLEKHLGY